MKKIIFVLVLSNLLFASYDVQRWLFRIGPEVDFGLRPTERSQPVMVGDNIYFGSEHGFFFSIRKDDGQVVWKKKIENGVSGSPLVHNGKIYFGANNGYLYCLSASDGQEIWKYRTKYASISLPLLVKGIIYITAGDNVIYALDAVTGKWLWQYKRNFPKALAIRGQSAPAYSNNYIFTGFSDGTFVKIHALDGKLIWEKRLNDYHKFIDIDAPAYVDGDRIIVSCYDGKLYALNSSNGSIVWQYEKGGAQGITVKDKNIYLPTGGGEIVVINRINGKKIWSHKGEKGVATTPTIHKDILLYGTTSNKLFALNLKTRKMVWSFSTGSGLSASPLVDNNGNLYFLTNQGNFYSIKIYPNLQKL